MFNFTLTNYDDEKIHIYNVNHENAQNFSIWYYNQFNDITFYAKNGNFIVRANTIKNILIERIG